MAYDPSKGLQPGQVRPNVPTPTTAPTPNIPTDEPNLRFNERYAGLFRNLDRQQTEITAQKQDALSQLQSGYQNQNAQAQRMQKLAKERLNAQMSDQGILRSGVTVGAHGDSQEEFLRYMNDLNNQHTAGVKDVENQTANALSQLGYQREQLMQEQAREEEIARLQEALNKARMEQQQPKPTATGQLVREAFQQHGLDPAAGNETAEQRIARIAHELDSGARTQQSVMQSLANLQQNAINNKDMPTLQKMVHNLFGQYNVDLTQGANPGESAQQRLARIAGQLANGDRNLDNLHASLRRLAG